MAQNCPQCRTPVPFERRVFRAWLWARWRCKTCDSLLGFNVKRRIIAGVLIVQIATSVVAIILFKFMGRSMLAFGIAAPIACMVGILFMLNIDDIEVIERRGRHCGGCGYNMQGNETGVCPECGAGAMVANMPMARAVEETRGT